jgi:hypothetical protein
MPAGKGELVGSEKDKLPVHPGHPHSSLFGHNSIPYTLESALVGIFDSFLMFEG